MTDFKQRYAELDEEFHEVYHPAHGGNMNRMLTEMLIVAEDKLQDLDDHYDSVISAGWSNLLPKKYWDTLVARPRQIIGKIRP